MPALNTSILSKVLLELGFQPCGQMPIIGLCHAACASKLGVVFPDAMVADVLSGFLLILCLLRLLCSDRCCCGMISFQDRKRVGCVADFTAGAWLDAMPVASNCVLGDGDVVLSLPYMLGEHAMKDKPLVCECWKPFSPGQAMRCRLQ